MKKLLFLMIIGLGGTMLIKGGHVTIGPDNQVRIAGYAVPLPEAVQNSPIMGMVTTVLMGQLPAAPQAAVATGGPGPAAPVRPMLPSVTSTNGTYSATAPASGSKQPTGSDQLSAVTKALRPQ